MVDPKAEKYFGFSGYNYVANNPLKYIDPKGEDIVLSINKTKRDNHTEVKVTSSLNLTIVGNVSQQEINKLKETFSKKFRDNLQRQEIMEKVLRQAEQL